MAKTPTAKTISEELGISPSYASMILTSQRVPPKNLAIAIFRKTNWRHPAIRKMRDEEMVVFERHEPWSPRPAKTSAAA